MSQVLAAQFYDKVKEVIDSGIEGSALATALSPLEENCAILEEKLGWQDPTILGDRTKWMMICSVRGIFEEGFQNLDYAIRWLSKNRCYLMVEKTSRSYKYVYTNSSGKEDFELCPYFYAWVVNRDTKQKLELFHFWQQGHGSHYTSLPDEKDEHRVCSTGEITIQVINYLLSIDTDFTKNFMDFIGADL